MHYQARYQHKPQPPALISLRYLDDSARQTQGKHHSREISMRVKLEVTKLRFYIECLDLGTKPGFLFGRALVPSQVL